MNKIINESLQNQEFNDQNKMLFLQLQWVLQISYL